MMLCVTWVALGALCPAGRLLAQEKQATPNDLDVTLQILVDPNARSADEVVRRIPLPAHKPAPATSTTQPAEQQKDSQKPDAADKGQERAREAQELGREMSESAKDKSKEASEQREQARRSVTENNGHPPKPPKPPGRPPRS